MSFRRLVYSPRLLALCLCVLGTSLLAACEKPTVSVSLHGVNYSGEAFSYYLIDPTDKKNQGGGELIDAYAAGGTTCCYELPRKWRAGLKVEVRARHWVGKSADGSLREIVGSHVVDVPPYADAIAGELWVLRGADGSMSLVSSNYQPDHPKWPGKVKGWPIPSVAYQRERWDIYIGVEQAGVDAYKELSSELNKSPDLNAERAWAHSARYAKESLIGFSGPEDPKYRTELRERYTEGLKRTTAKLKELKEGRP